MRAKFFIVAICCAWLTVGPTLCLSQDPAPTTASQPASMPAWIVPVLRLVSATHVEPTTGVVISPTGLVLVANDFASSDDEIIVLDGGTDIIRNGRPAKIAYQFPAQGLMVLSVKSLRRKAARFTAGDLTDGSSVRLQAFPPAKWIEQGAPPLDVSATIYIHAQSNKITLSSATPLPNVTGPILDACGRLAGYSTADGLQSMSTTELPRYHWKDSLMSILNEMQIDIIELPCERLPSALEPQDETVVEAVDEINDGKPADDEPDLEEESRSALDVLPPLEEIDDPADSDVHEETETEAKDDGVDVAADKDSGLPAWVWFLASIFLLISAFILHRIRNSRSLNAQTRAPAGQPSSVLAQEGDEEPAYPVPGLDSLLVIEGKLSDGTEFKQSCKVSRNAINLVIGRGNADINIDSSAISRQHVRLNGTREMLTITDLGSSNGSSINGIPCFAGETMFIEPGDIIILGDARFGYKIVRAKDT